MKTKYEKPLTLKELATLPETEIDYSDIPELDKNFWKNAKVSSPKTKPNVSLRVSEEVIAYFKADEPKGYTKRMAGILESFVLAHQEK